MNHEEKQGQKEITKATEETATTSALENKWKIVFSVLFKSIKLKFIFAGLILFFASTFAGIGYFKLFHGNTFAQDQVSFVNEIHALSTLATAEAVVTTVIEQEDNKLFGKDISVNFPGTKRKLLLVVPASVIAGVDLKAITSEQININENTKEIQITLPKATIIQEPSIQMENIKTYSVEGLFRNEVNWDEGYLLAAEAKQQVRDEAENMGILKTAEEHAEKVIINLLESFDYKATVQFK